MHNLIGFHSKKPVIKVFLVKTGMKKSLKEKAFLLNALIGLSPFNKGLFITIRRLVLYFCCEFVMRYKGKLSAAHSDADKVITHE